MKKQVLLSAIALFAMACTVTATDQLPTHVPDVAEAHAALSAGPPRVIVTGNGAADAVRANGGHVDHEYSVINGVAATLPSQAVAHSLRNARLTVEPDHLAFISAPPTCNPKKGCGDPDPEPDPEPPAPSDPQYTPWAVTVMGAEASGLTGAGVDVLIIDTGSDCTHEDLNCVDGRNYTRGRIDKYQDDNGHGTYVHGELAAIDNAVGIRGMAPDANIYVCKALDRNGSGYYSDIIACIDWGVSLGVDVMSMSLGGSVGTTSLHDAIKAAHAADISLIAAAGNSGYTNAPEVGYPAAYPEVVAVGAFDMNYTIAYFSSYGPGLVVERSAHGVNVPGTLMGGGYDDTWNGTSMSTPLDAGAVVLMHEAYPSHSSDCLRTHLNVTATDLGGNDLQDVKFGHGVVNLTNALASAAGGCN